jgi:hypothetical protein
MFLRQFPALAHLGASFIPNRKAASLIAHGFNTLQLSITQNILFSKIENWGIFYLCS